MVSIKRIYISLQHGHRRCGRKAGHIYNKFLSKTVFYSASSLQRTQTNGKHGALSKSHNVVTSNKQVVQQVEKNLVTAALYPKSPVGVTDN